jgi:hypothetical protein
LFFIKYFLAAPSIILILLTLITLIVYYIIIIRNDPMLFRYLDSIPLIKKSIQYE